MKIWNNFTCFSMEWKVGKHWFTVYQQVSQTRLEAMLRYSRITSTKSLSFCMTTCSACLTNLTALLPQSRDSSYYASKQILAPPPLWPQKHTNLRPHDFARSSDLWRQPRIASVTCAWSWRLCEINIAIAQNAFSDTQLSTLITKMYKYKKKYILAETKICPL
jgi:hypothetical protein